MITRQDLATAGRAHRNLLIFTVLYSVATIIAGLSVGARPVEFVTLIGLFLGGPLLMIGITPLFILAVYGMQALDAIILNGRPRQQAIAAMRAKIAIYFTGPRLANSIAGTFVVFPLMIFFCGMKSLIPLLRAYHLDPMLAEIDRAVHGGHYSYEFFLPVINNSFAFHVFDTFYEVYWFVALYLLTSYAVWLDPNEVRRRRFLWSFCLGWTVIGTILALAAASVGPLFYAEIYPDLTSPYSDLVARLAQQNIIRHTNLAGDIDFFHQLMADKRHVIKLNALSSMPSMHVAIAALTCFYLWTMKDIWRWLGLVYFIMIFIGSVALGWHYAIDGYVGALFMAAFWWSAAKWIVPKTFPGKQ